MDAYLLSKLIHESVILFDLNHIKVYLFLNTLLKKLYFKIVFIESNFPIE